MIENLKIDEKSDNKKEKSKKTKSTSFILPMLGKSIYFYNPFLINCFVGDKRFCRKYSNHIFVLLKIEDNNEYKTVEKDLKSLNNFVLSYIPIKNETKMMVFKVPEEYTLDYFRFLRGEYSKFSNRLKEEVMKLNNVNKKSVIYAAFTKAKWLKETWEKELNCKILPYSEVLSIPNLENEIYNKNK